MLHEKSPLVIFSNRLGLFAIAALAAYWPAGRASASVFNMGAGLTSIQFTTVGNPGNPGTGSPSVGAVGYSYQMDTFEVSAAQYTEFLNAVGKTDPFALYNTTMDRNGPVHDNAACNIVRSGGSGSFSYSVASDYANLPVNLVLWGSAARFCNWLTNGQPQTGVEDATTTEDGSYFLNGATSNAAIQAVTRKPNAIYVIPTDNEWVKAGFYSPGKSSNAGYWQFATQSDSTPASTLPFTTPNDANSTNLGDPTHLRTPIGAFTNSASAFGTFDQDGNVFEMTEGIPTGSPGARTIRGGGYSGTTGFLVTDSSTINPVFPNDLVGFRIAELPEPSAILLFLVAGTALTARRRKLG